MVTEKRLYRFGPGIELLGMLTRGTQPDLRSAAMPSVYALAESSGDTVFLVARDRADTVCIARASGSYPIRAITIEVGTRRPLGVGAGGIAILGALERRECERLVAVLAPRLDALPHTTAAQVAKAAEAARRHGHAFSDEQVVRGVRGVSVAIRDVRGSPVAAIGIAAIRERLRRERVQELVERLLVERNQIEGELEGLRRQSAIERAVQGWSVQDLTKPPLMSSRGDDGSSRPALPCPGIAPLFLPAALNEPA